MKKICTLFLSLLSVISVYAQISISDIRRDTVIEESNDRYKVVTNHFWDNWVIGAGAGAQIYFGDHAKQMKFGDRLAPAYNLYVGKWFSPGLGIRAMLNGMDVHTATQNGDLATGGPIDGKPWDGYWLNYMDFKYLNVHVDAMFNLTNIFSGFRSDRFYTISPYLGAGWAFTTDNQKSREASINVGLYNTFRLAKSLDLTLDVQGNYVHDRFDGTLGERYGEGPLSATLGLAYRFGERSWEKPRTVTVTYDEAALRDIIDKANALANDNEALKKQLAESKSDVITDVQYKNHYMVAPLLVTFEINKSIVRNEARVNLGFFAKMLKEGSPEVVYTVTGYADKGTGTPAINERLSRERSQAIYNVLVREFGVDPKQLRVSHEGGVDNMFYDDPGCSRAVIVIGK